MQFWIATQLVNRYGALFIWLVRIRHQFFYLYLGARILVSEDARAPPLRHSPLKPWAHCVPRARGHASFCFGGCEPGPSHYGYLRCIKARNEHEHVTWRLQQLWCFDTNALYVSRIALLFAGGGTAEPTHFGALLLHQETAAGQEIPFPYIKYVASWLGESREIALSGRGQAGYRKRLGAKKQKCTFYTSRAWATKSSNQRPDTNP